MRQKILPVLLLVLIPLTAAEIQFRGDVNRERIQMNTTIELECSDTCPVSSWRLSWDVPDGAEILEVRDGLGRIEDYELNQGTLKLETNSERRRKATVRIRMRIERDAENIYGDLFYRKFSIPSFSGEKTTGVFKVENLVSGWIGFGFNTSFVNDTFRFSGTGPTNFRVNFGEGEESDYYEFFGGEKQDTEQAYEIAVGTTGLVQQFEKFPVAVMDGKSFNETVNRWSAGEYYAGTLTLRENLEENYLPILAHETVHGLNDRFLNWDRTSSSYLDEGVAEYVEYLVKNRLYQNGSIEVGPASLFGDERKYRVEKKDGTYVYTVPPQGDRERLWNYYQQDRDFMEKWNPREYPDFRSFGYAYSHLIIRYHAAKNGSVRELYRSLDFDSTVDSPREKWTRLSGEIDLTPCRYESRQRFEECLEKVNSYDYPVYSASPDGKKEKLLIEEVEIPNRTEKKPGKTSPPETIESKRTGKPASLTLSPGFSITFSHFSDAHF